MNERDIASTPCRYVKSIAGAHGYVWTFRIERRYRHIYIRCLTCRRIFELGEEPETLHWPLKIFEGGTISPCVVCPYCRSHVWTKLLEYKKTGTPDIFRKSRPRRRRTQKDI